MQNHTSSEVYSEDGILLGKYFIHERTNVPYKKISRHIINSLIVTEDVRFFHHKGVDTRGMFRVAVKSILMGNENSGGGSTISQQLAKNIFPRKKYWAFSLPVNKLREIIIAGKMEDVFTKEEILALYLNTVPFGENAYGIATASERYFNKPQDSLKIEEAAVLIGMLKAPSSYNPKRNPEKSLSRRNVVIGQLVKYKYLPAEKADSIKQLPLKINYANKTHVEGIATYFREQLRLELQQRLEKIKKEDGSSYNLYTDGLKIYTTIDSKMQQYAEEAVNEHMSQLQNSFITHWRNKNPWGSNEDVVEMAKRRSDRYIRLKEEGFSEEEINKNFKEPLKMKIFSYKGESEKIMSPLDSIKYYLKFLRPGFLAMDPETGYVKAWVGGIDMKYFKYDHVNIHTKRQVGSAFKPIVYAAALQNGVTPCEYIDNEKVVYEEFDNWSPRNSDDQYGGMYSVQGALTNSVNTISAQLIMRAGIPNVISLAKKMGIQSQLEPIPSLALGTADVSLFEMVTAFNVFANNGNYVPTKYLLKVTDAKGNIILDFTEKKNKRRVLSKEHSDMMIKMLQNVVDHGTAARLRYKYGVEGDIAGKTGTTQSHADGWFIGFTPTIIAGAWVGAEDRRIHFRSMDLGQGASTALPIWGIFVKKIYGDTVFKKMKNQKFSTPHFREEEYMTCQDFIPPDTTNFFEDLFSFGRKEETPHNKHEKENSLRKNEPVLERKRFSFKDLFKKKH